MPNKTLILIGAGVALVLVLAAAWAARNGRSFGAGAVGFADDVAGGVVEGLGDLVGVPRTDKAECALALSEGRLWDASFACPAADFFGGLFDPAPRVTPQSVVTAPRGDFWLYG